MLKSLWNDESGVILSAELVLIGTILILGLLVGMVELRTAIVAELSDLASAFGNLNQSYVIAGVASVTDGNHIKARSLGASYFDSADLCDCDQNLIIVCNDGGEIIK